MNKIILRIEGTGGKVIYGSQDEIGEEGKQRSTLFENEIKLPFEAKVVINKGNFELFEVQDNDLTKCTILLIHTLPENIELKEVLEYLRPFDDSISMVRVVNRKHFIFLEEFIGLTTDQALMNNEEIGENNSENGNSEDQMTEINENKGKGEKDPKSEYMTGLIIYFSDSLELKNCSTNLREKFKDNPMGDLHCLYIESVHFFFAKMTENEELQFKEVVKEMGKKKLLPGCIACLEKLESNLTGLTHLSVLPLKLKDQHHRWLNCKSSCSVCNLLMTDASDNECIRCGKSEMNWVCMICGYVGCGRYIEADAVYHYERTNHCFAVEMEDKSIWSYFSDSFVHRISGENFHGFERDNQEGRINDDILISLNFQSMLGEQLAIQKEYFEDKIENLKVSCLEKLNVGSEVQLKETYRKKDQVWSELKAVKDTIKAWPKEKEQLLAKFEKIKTEQQEINSVKSNIEAHIQYLEENDQEVEKMDQKLLKEQLLLESFQKKLAQMYEQLS